jgi:methylenetetrahydrofolate dehydrogenase (NADP+)/methenyltetrahydrofolate cyclohydrolase
MNFELNKNMRKLIDGKKIAEKILAETAKKVLALKKKNITPKLGVILIGNDKASLMYDTMKGKAAQKIGIDFDLHRFSTTITLAALVDKIRKIQEDTNLSGLIIQLPVPERLYKPELLNAVNPKIDVDCLTDVNLGKLVMNTQTIQPPTAGAVLKILEELNVDLVGKNVCIVGMGILVGKPLANLLINARASVTTCNSKTKNLKQKCLAADSIVSGVGKKNLIRGNMVKKGAIVIDSGISFENGKLSGDVNVNEVLKNAKFVTPTPGGVGPITVALLLYNTVLCAEKNQKLKR